MKRPQPEFGAKPGLDPPSAFIQSIHSVSINFSHLQQGSPTMLRRDLLFLLGQCAAPVALGSTLENQAQEADVYQGYLNSIPSSFPRDRALVIHPSTLVLSRHLPALKTADQLLAKVPGLNQAVAENLMRVRDSQTAVTLHAERLGKMPRIHRPSDSDLAKTLGDGTDEAAWANFYKSYPRAIGLTQFSAVGFNDAFNEAAIFVYTRGGAGPGGYGSGDIAVLRKTQGQWTSIFWTGLWLDGALLRPSSGS